MCLLKYITVAAFCIYAQRGEEMKMLLKHGLNSPGNYIFDDIEKSRNCVFEFLWEPWLAFLSAIG